MSKLNPYYLYGLSFSLVLFCYSFNWSDLYPHLTWSLVFFLIFSIVLSFCCGIYFNRNFLKINEISKEKFQFKKIYYFFSILIVLGNIINGIYSGGYPLFNSFSYNNYGMPLINAILGVFSSYFASCLFLTFLIEKKRRFVLVFLYLLSLSTFVLALSRGMIILTLLNCFWEYIYYSSKKDEENHKFKIRKIISFFILTVVFIYMFGLAGNFRLNKEVGVQENNIFNSELILNVGDASKGFYSSKIPEPFFWTYLYATSPLANFQNITINDKDIDQFQFKAFVYTQLLPTLIGKRVFPQFYQNKFNSADKTSNTISSFNQSNQFQISNNLNVGTLYFVPYYLMGWYGVLLIFIFVLLFPILYFTFFRNLLGEFNIYAFSIFNTIYFLLIFDNFFVFTGLSLQLVFPILQGIYMKIRRK